jgi:hypothetical protein
MQDSPFAHLKVSECGGKRPALCPIELAHGFRAWDAFRAAINHLGRIEIDGRTEKDIVGRDESRLLATMDAELIKKLKLVAIEDDTSASEATEEAAKERLERRKSKAKKA